jgi:hypothetical protein
VVEVEGVIYDASVFTADITARVDLGRQLSTSRLLPYPRVGVGPGDGSLFVVVSGIPDDSHSNNSDDGVAVDIGKDPLSTGVVSGHSDASGGDTLLFMVVWGASLVTLQVKRWCIGGFQVSWTTLRSVCSS